MHNIDIAQQCGKLGMPGCPIPFYLICYTMSRGRTGVNLLRKSTLQWRHNDCDGISNHRHHGCLLNRLFRRRSRKTPKLCTTSLCEGTSPVTGGFPAEMASNAEMFPLDDVIMNDEEDHWTIHSPASRWGSDQPTSSRWLQMPSATTMLTWIWL